MDENMKEPSNVKIEPCDVVNLRGSSGEKEEEEGSGGRGGRPKRKYQIPKYTLVDGHIIVEGEAVTRVEVSLMAALPEEGKGGRGRSVKRGGGGGGRG